MKVLNAGEIVGMFMEGGEEYGFRSVFEGTFGGVLLHDEETGNFIWMSEAEHQQLQDDAAGPSILDSVRHQLATNASNDQLLFPCHEPDDLEDTA